MVMNRFVGLVALALFAAPTLVQAANSVLSDEFTGEESSTAPLPGNCAGAFEPLPYQDTGSFQVAASGDYLVVDAFNFVGVDVTALIYDGAFDPGNPGNNLVTQGGIDEFATVSLSAGVDYRLVVQNWCRAQQGAWALTFSGPGNVTSAVSRMIPAMTQGQFTEDDPVAATECNPSGYYQESGPMQVASSGQYFYSDILLYGEVDACLQVYTAPFNPASPNDNRVGAALDDAGSVELEAGRDYWFVVQPLEFSFDQTGEYFYVLAPPAPFRINKALAGGWFNSEVSGQGFLLDVYENINFMFLAWFTFDAARPDPGVPSTVGEAGQRWLTAQGAYQGDSASLDLFNAQDMIFNSPTPPVNNVPDGSLDIEFANCTEGTIRYDIPSSGLSGTIPIEPLVGPDIDSSTLELCKSFASRPGVPGPL